MAFQAPFLGCLVLQILDLIFFSLSRIFLFMDHPNPGFSPFFVYEFFVFGTGLTKHSFLNPYFAHL